MNRENFAGKIVDYIDPTMRSVDMRNYFSLEERESDAEQLQTNEAFSEKWDKFEKSSEKECLYELQKTWYLELYGFASPRALAEFLQNKPVIFDAGCGLGYKAAWFAELAPESLVIGMDSSGAVVQAAKNYQHLANLFFVKGDIAETGFPRESVDYVSCDQVIMHTQDPDKTFRELTRITRRDGGEFACYFYAQKALPRELLDDHFRSHCIKMTSEELWEMSAQLTELGKRLSELKITFDAPDIPALGIKGGNYDLQRFVYWNFIKCFWNDKLGRETSIITNYDWYSPSNARRYSKKEILSLVARNELSIAHFHQEEACYSGRFVR